jgi:GNAT superfamily N-acetyltransferase
MADIRITQTQPEYIPQLVELQIVCYPTLADSSRLKAPHFESHLRIFPEGQWVALDDVRVVGMSAGFLITFDFEHPNHTFDEIIGYGFFTRHDPHGAYFYGADVSVHPDYRGRGIARRLYDARKALVRERGLRGIVTGAMIPGFADYKMKMDAPTYVARVVAGEIFDPTLSVQLRQGFRVRGLLPNYLPDSATDGWSVLIEWVPDPS